MSRQKVAGEFFICMWIGSIIGNFNENLRGAKSPRMWRVYKSPVSERKSLIAAEFRVHVSVHFSRGRVLNPAAMPLLLWAGRISRKVQKWPLQGPRLLLFSRFIRRFWARGDSSDDEHLSSLMSRLINALFLTFFLRTVMITWMFERCLILKRNLFL